uniref:Transposase n=1 Tax=Strongyloides venezuelensis TaxID=75913 RepID=A0A0K0FJU9_STRVS
MTEHFHTRLLYNKVYSHRLDNPQLLVRLYGLLPLMVKRGFDVNSQAYTRLCRIKIVAPIPSILQDAADPVLNTPSLNLKTSGITTKTPR